MAKEKNKNDLIEKIIEEEIPTRKTKRNRRKTECSINRRHGCGICGSLNVCFQGVKYCEKCGAEEEILDYNIEYFFEKRKRICDCKEIDIRDLKKPKAVQRLVDVTLRTIGVKKCIDCGAVLTNRSCPNNKKHRCWKHWNNKKYCINCGFKT